MLHMPDWECPHCGQEYEGTGYAEQDCGERTCGECGERYRVVVEYEATYFAGAIDNVSPEQQKRNDAMERGDYLRDRRKDERIEK